MPDWHLQHNNIPERFLVCMVLLGSHYAHARLVTFAMDFGYLYNCLVSPFFKIRRDSMMLGKGLGGEGIVFDKPTVKEIKM